LCCSLSLVRSPPSLPLTHSLSLSLYHSTHILFCFELFFFLHIFIDWYIILSQKSVIKFLTSMRRINSQKPSNKEIATNCQPQHPSCHFGVRIRVRQLSRVQRAVMTSSSQTTYYQAVAYYLHHYLTTQSVIITLPPPTATLTLQQWELQRLE
jgi:hypothetical protein